MSRHFPGDTWRKTRFSTRNGGVTMDWILPLGESVATSQGDTTGFSEVGPRLLVPLLTSQRLYASGTRERLASVHAPESTASGGRVTRSRI